VAKAKNKASPSIRRLKPTAIHTPNISSIFNLFLIVIPFISKYRWLQLICLLLLLLPLASANGLQTVQRLLALAPFSSITKHLKNAAKARNKASTSIRRLKPTAIYTPNILLIFNIFFFSSYYLHFLLQLALSSIAVGFSQRFANSAAAAGFSPILLDN
jgi:hypothetical protein